MAGKAEDNGSRFPLGEAARYFFVLFCILVMGMKAAHAECPSDAAVAEWAGAWKALQPMTQPPSGLSYPDALCGQRKLAAELAADWGVPIGMHVTMADRKTPARGIILSGMVIGNSTILPAAFGARPRVEAALMFTIRDAAIMTAKTPLETLTYLGELIPVIVLMDGAWAEDVRPDYATLVTANVGLRYGVVGQGIKLTPDIDWVTALAGLTSVLEDGKSQPTIAQSKDILGSPLVALVWLIADLRRRGEGLQAGDVVSLGGFMGSRQPTPGQTLRLRFDGLANVTPQVSVTFQ